MHVVWPSCHSWHESHNRSVSAMLFLAALAALAIWGIAATLLALRSDGYGPCPTEWERAPDRGSGDHGRPYTPGIGPRQG